MADLLKHKVSKIYGICMKLWPDEFQKQYAGRREDFNNWLNEKTGLNEDHTHNRTKAIKEWLSELEFILEYAQKPKG